MELPKLNRVVESSGTFEDEYFAIGDMALVMEILRNKLYTDPIKALTQEIASNARDAHRENGKIAQPIEVFLPSTMNPNFHIRDFGPGITPDRMVNVFIRYGCSTKRDDNTQTGGFGIGAKSPFAYTDSFGVESITPDANGQMVKRVYVAYIDETNKGKISLVTTEVTNEAQGTKIIVPVKPNDMRLFADNIRRACSYWDIRPTILNSTDFEWNKDECFKIRSGEQFWFRHEIGGNCRNRNNENIALIDGIPYPLDLDEMIGYHYDADLLPKYGLKSEEHNAIRKASQYGLCLKFGVGELTITANREAIDNKEVNVKLIISRLRDAINRLKTVVVEDVAAQPTPLAASYLLRSPYYESIRRIFGMNFDFSSSDTSKLSDFENSLVNNGVLVKPGIRLPAGLKAVTFSVRKHFARNLFHDAPKKVNTEAHSEVVQFTSQYVTLAPECANFWRDVDQCIKPRIANLLKTQTSITNVALIQYDEATVDAVKNPNWRQDALAWIQANLPPAMFDIKNISTLPIVKPPRRPRAPALPGQSRSRKLVLDTLYRFCANGRGGWEKVSPLPTDKPLVVLKGGSYGAPTLFGHVLTHTRDDSRDDWRGDVRNLASILDCDIYKVAGDRVDQLPQNCVLAEDAVAAYIAKSDLADQETINLAEAVKARLEEWRGLLSRFRSMNLSSHRGKIAENSPLHEAFVLIDMVAKNDNLALSIKQTKRLIAILEKLPLKNMPQTLQDFVAGHKSTISDAQEKVDKVVRRMSERYPLLAYLENAPIGKVIDYIKMVDDTLASVPMIVTEPTPEAATETQAATA